MRQYFYFFQPLFLLGVEAHVLDVLSNRARKNGEGKCASSICGGIAKYPVKHKFPGDTVFYSEFDVPGLPEKIDDITG